MHRRKHQTTRSAAVTAQIMVELGYHPKAYRKLTRAYHKARAEHDALRRAEIPTAAGTSGTSVGPSRALITSTRRAPVVGVGDSKSVVRHLHAPETGSAVTNMGESLSPVVFRRT